MSMLGRQSPDPRDERLGGSLNAGPSKKEENIYIPQFITKRPFYAIDEEDELGEAKDDAGASGTSISRGSRDYLEHQRLRKTEEESKWRQRGRKSGPAATKYRKGACENCGAMGHKRRDCLSRPRARLAKYSGEDIQADEAVEDVKQGWDAKRDRWQAFDPRDYSTMMAQRERLNEARRALKEKVAAGSTSAEEAAGEEGEPGGALAIRNNNDGGGAISKDEDTRYSEDADMGVSRTNGAADLRMREDTARYLINLDIDSAKYDPKRRRIVDGGAFIDESARLFAEQNFSRVSGDAEAFEREQRYAWEVQDQTGDASLHLQANPTAAAHARRRDAEEAQKKQEELDRLMREKYGVGVISGGGDDDSGSKTELAAAGTTRKAASLATAVKTTEHFVEYDESGQVKEKFQPRREDRSKYAEDVFPQNHTSVWGSWWHDFQWGYACCHSFVRNSYCTGEEGKAAWERAERQRLGDWGDEGDDDASEGEGRGEPKLLTARGEERDEDGLDDEDRRRRRRAGSSPPRKKKREQSARET